ncbi:putative nicotinate-nucleotide adenylyltransferase [Jannaschia seosinensis]|uniref:Probable nicotinate-nucleotide adenylyltransferase n=1 Tax=Jannaschia seosinensis TaxID=313367 RepID=A0A0M7BD56_9RHOB|nr:nicotinate-nucleotide adenylyltransferase [Jannaschia seosinensis]CUH40670.1 putative nicotinate-nucleotide adenylyltransferase [Jannaschia seosinensis]
MRAGLPYARPGQVVGLLGGSFDPAHAGHVHITREALKRLGLDRVWWLVSPGNPLKVRGPAPLARRMAHARAVMRHPRVDVTDLEARLGTRHTARTIAVMQERWPGVRFVWLMGADNLAQFHMWEDWREIFARVPIAVLARPGQRLRARTAPAAAIYRRFRLPASAAGGIGYRKPPAWIYLNIPMNAASSSEIRAGGGWDQPS